MSASIIQTLGFEIFWELFHNHNNIKNARWINAPKRCKTQHWTKKVCTHLRRPRCEAHRVQPDQPLHQMHTSNDLEYFTTQNTLSIQYQLQISQQVFWTKWCNEYNEQKDAVTSHNCIWPLTKPLPHVVLVQSYLNPTLTRRRRPVKLWLSPHVESVVHGSVVRKAVCMQRV